MPQPDLSSRHSLIARLRPLALVAALVAVVAALPTAAQPEKTDFDPRQLTPHRTALNATFRPLAKAVRPSMAMIRTDGQNAVYGTIVSADGQVLTKASELSGRLTVLLFDGRELPADLIATDHENDLALLKIAAEKLSPVQWAEAKPDIGRWLITPNRRGAVRAVGIVSVQTRPIRSKRLVLGVQLDVESIKNQSTVRVVGAWMGAARAGIQAGDELVRVAGVRVMSEQSIQRALEAFRHGDAVDVELLREGKPVKVQVELSRHEPPPTSRAARMNRMGTQVSHRRDGFASVIQHDTVIEPWECGGPVLDSQGRAVGLNIARAGRVATYALPAELVLDRLDAMRSGELGPGEVQQGRTAVTHEPVPVGQ